jgi:DNA-binding MarR family transcriptional regulator
MSDDYIEEVEREISAFFLAAERSQARRVLPEVGRLEKTAFHLLGQLVREGALRPSAIAQLVRLDLSTVSRHVGALESAGLVARDPDPADRRAWLLRATDRGEQILARLRAARRQRLRAALADWPTEDRRELVRLLGRLNQDLSRVAQDLSRVGEPTPGADLAPGPCLPADPGSATLDERTPAARAVEDPWDTA